MFRATLRLIGLLWAMPGAAFEAQIEQETFGCKSLANALQLLSLRQTANLTDGMHQVCYWSAPEAGSPAEL